MNRIGVHYTQVLDFVRGINFHRGIQCDGVFTHFATADEPSGWDYKLQCQRFTEAVQAIKDAGLSAVSCTAPTRRPRCSTPRCILI